MRHCKPKGGLAEWVEGGWKNGGCDKHWNIPITYTEYTGLLGDIAPQAIRGYYYLCRHFSEFSFYSSRCLAQLAAAQSDPSLGSTAMPSLPNLTQYTHTHKHILVLIAVYAW